VQPCTLKPIWNPAPPGDVAGILQLHVGQELAADGGEHAIRADAEIGFGRGPIGGTRQDAAPGLLDLLQLLAVLV